MAPLVLTSYKGLIAPCASLGAFRPHPRIDFRQAPSRGRAKRVERKPHALVRPSALARRRGAVPRSASSPRFTEEDGPLLSRRPGISPRRPRAHLPLGPRLQARPSASSRASSWACGSPPRSSTTARRPSFGRTCTSWPRSCSCSGRSTTWATRSCRSGGCASTCPRRTSYLTPSATYSLLIGIKKFTMPPEGKYFESEKAAYVMAVVTAVLLVVSGLFKAAAHVFLALPDGLMDVMFWIHDIAAALMLVFLAAHVFFAVIAPFSWKTFPSMFTGWMPLSEAEKEHRGWLERLQREHREHDGRTAGRSGCPRGNRARGGPRYDDDRGARSGCARFAKEMREMADTNERAASAQGKSGLSRRQFLAGIGGLGVGAVLGSGITALLLPDDVYAIEASQGYLLVDAKKCGACETCMHRLFARAPAAASTREPLAPAAHQKPARLLPRVRRAAEPVPPVPVPFLRRRMPHRRHARRPRATGVRLVAEGKCIGCERCIEACPFTPSRVQWNYEDKCAQKCDLCLNTPYWDEAGRRSGREAGRASRSAPCGRSAFTRTSCRAQSDEGYDGQPAQRALPGRSSACRATTRARVPPAQLGYGASVAPPRPRRRCRRSNDRPQGGAPMSQATGTASPARSSS